MWIVDVYLDGFYQSTESYDNGVDAYNAATEWNNQGYSTRVYTKRSTLCRWNN